MYFDEKTQTLEGIPDSRDNGDYSLEVTAEGPVVEQAHSLARSVFNVHVQEHNSHLDTDAVPLSQNAIGFQPIRCSKGSPITMATVIIDGDYNSMKVKEKINLMRKFSKHLDMPKEILRLMPVGNRPIFDSSALVAGPGDVKTQLFPGVLLQWEVGCGNVNARQMQVLQEVETSSQDGKMSQAVGYGILGWHVTNNKPYKLQRIKRQVNIQPTATLLPTEGPPTGRPVVTKTLTDTEPSDSPESRTVPTMASPSIIAPSKTQIHKPHRTKTKGRHSHHTKDMDKHKDKTKYFTATPTPTMGPIKPTRVVDMSSTMVIDLSVARVTPTEIEPSPGVSRTETLIEPSIVPTKPMDTKATDILPSRTFTAPIDTRSSGPPMPSKTDTTPEATKSTPMLPPDFTKSTETPTKKPKPSRKPVGANFPPMLNQEIRRLTASVGEVFHFRLPENMFIDEDGNTRDLKIVFSDIHDKSLSPYHWLRFDEEKQVLFGIPLTNDVGKHEYLIKAIDSQNQIGSDAFDMHVKNPAENLVLTHVFVTTLNEVYERFKMDVMRRYSVADKISNVYGDPDPTNILLVGLEKGSVKYSWTNKTLLGTGMNECPSREIGELISKVIHRENSSLREEFLDGLKPHEVMEVEVKKKGPCGDGTFVVGHPDIKNTIPVETRPADPREEDILITTIVPAVVIAAMLLLALFIACILYRKKRKGKLSDEDQHTFIKRGIPIVFQDELDDKPCPPTRPLILDEEKPPLPPPEYHRSGGGSFPSTPPSDHKEPIDTTEDERDDDITSPLYPPPPPLNSANNRRSRPPIQQSYKSPPPYSYVPP